MPENEKWKAGIGKLALGTSAAKQEERDDARADCSVSGLLMFSHSIAGPTGQNLKK